jgi:hypothetical protein
MRSGQIRSRMHEVQYPKHPVFKTSLCNSYVREMFLNRKKHKAHIPGGEKTVHVVFEYIYVQKPAVERVGGRSNAFTLNNTLFLSGSVDIHLKTT